MDTKHLNEISMGSTGIPKYIRYKYVRENKYLRFPQNLYRQYIVIV